jgi:hypothetical protein
LIAATRVLKLPAEEAIATMSPLDADAACECVSPDPQLPQWAKAGVAATVATRARAKRTFLMLVSSKCF